MSISLLGQTNYSTPYTEANFVKTIDLNRPVGTVTGEASPTPTGASTYNIPIFTPPGTNSVLPSVGISYSSQGGTGIAGYGWSISGLSSIIRIGKNLYHNDKVAPVELLFDDAFAMDGLRLNLIAGNGSVSSIYATENETYSKIIREGGDLVNPGWFNVYTKDGMNMQFGNTTDSKVMTDDGQNVMIYRLNRITDINGNYVDFRYDNTNRDSRIDEILYTGNSNTALPPYNRIKFTYGNRYDNNTSYDAGSSFNSSYLLNQIIIFHKSDAGPVETVKTYNFKYGFDNVHSLLKEIEECGAQPVIPVGDKTSGNTENGNPENIETTSNCLNSTIFLYGDATGGISVSQTPSFSSGTTGYNTGDFDADGKSDLLMVKSYFDPNMNMRFDSSYTVYRGTNPNTPIYTKSLPQGTSLKIDDKKFYNFLTSDYNKDGRDDILEMRVSWNAQHLKRQVNNLLINFTGTNGFTSQTFSAPFDGYNLVHASGNFFVPGDFDGDGNQDYILILGKHITGTNNYEYRAYLTRPALMEINVPVIGLGNNMLPFPDEGMIGVASASKLTPIDMDGDGKMEILITTNPTYGNSSSFLYKLIRNGTQYDAYYEYNYNPITEIDKNCKLYPGDFNGDKKTDLLIRKGDGTWKSLHSNGRSFISSFFPFNQPVQMVNLFNHKILVTDFNGDGKSDVLHGISDGYAPTSTLSVYYNKGMDSWHNENYTYNNPIPSVNQTQLPNGQTSYEYFTYGDFNGDGRTDFFHSLSPTVNEIVSIKPNSKERLLLKVTNGHNVTTAFDYKLLTDKSATPYVYNRTISLDNPLNQTPYNYVQLPMMVVSGYTVPDGLGGTNTTNYFYEDAVVHRHARGFLGFKKVTSVNTQLQSKSVTESEINTQFAMPYSVKQSAYFTDVFPVQDELLAETFITNSFIDLSTGPNDKRFIQRVDKTIQKDHLNGTAAETESSYDSYGNVTAGISKKGFIPSGSSTITAVETVTNSTTYSWVNPASFPVPSHPTHSTTVSQRSGQPSATASTQINYNAIGLPSSKVEFYGLPKAVTTSFNYDVFGNVLQTTTSATGVNSRVSNITYDLKGRFALTKEALDGANSQKEFFTYDTKWGQPLTHKDIECITTTFEYDNFGMQKKTIFPEGYSVTNTLNWDVQGEQIFYAFTDYSGGKPDAKGWNDKLGRTIKTQSAGFNNQWLTQLTTFNNKGQVSTKTNAYYPGETPFVTTSFFDNYGRPYSTSTPLNTTNFTYTKLADGKMQVTVSSAGQSSSKITDAAGKVITAIDNGGQLDYSYDSRGSQTETKHNSTVLVTSVYDVYGRQTSLIDKNAGTITYQYDAFGQLLQQTDANGNTYNNTYDGFGRQLTRQGPEGTTSFQYFFGSAIKGCWGHQLKKIIGFNGILKEYEYDFFKRLASEKVAVDGTEYLTSYTYDAYSNLASTTYPSGVVVNNIYDNNGGLLTVTGGDSGNPITLFTANGVNGYGQYTSYTLGNGKTSQNTYQYGMPTRLYTPGVQDLNCSFDFTKGNLNSRYDALKNLTENFQYDNLDRLTTSTVNGVQQLAINYDGTNSFSKGNIVNKTDAGNYVYRNDKIHAVAYITNPAGPLAPPVTPLPSNDQQITYTPFLKAASITDGGVQTVFTYGPDYQRIKTVLNFNGTPNTTKYFLGDMERVISGGYVRDIHFIAVGNSLAVIEKPVGGSSTIHYIYTDYLGSLLTRTDANGNVNAEQNFDAWGRLRSTANWQWANYISGAFFDRGYTGHEHLQYHDIINMNGRLYDPVQGRMISPDNYVPDPWHTQGYNRYSYANNNPLKFTDPDGNFIIPILIGAVVGGFFKGVQYDMQGKGFLNGFWRGAITGAAAGGLAMIGGGTFIANVAWGMGQGIAVNGLGNILEGKNFFDGAFAAGVTGGIFAAISSGIEAHKNFEEGFGYGTNSGRLKRMIDEYQGSIGTANEGINANKAIGFVQKRFLLNNTSFSYDNTLHEFGSTNVATGNVRIGSSAFESSSMLKATMAHEYWHSKFDRIFVNGRWRANLRNPNTWNYGDGVGAYKNEIRNMGRMHISKTALNKLIPQSQSSIWTYGNKTIVNAMPANPEWFARSVSKFRFFYRLPHRWF